MEKEVARACLKLARQSIEHYLKAKEILKIPQNLPDFLLKNKKGVFVSIFQKKTNELRGCIGTYLPTKENIAKEIIDNAISAGFKDPRFPPLTLDELSKVYLEVSLLDIPVLISSLEELDPEIYGIIIKTQSGRQALLLPKIPGIDTREQQIWAVCQKGQINPLKEKCQFYRFRTQKFSEKDIETK